MKTLTLKEFTEQISNLAKKFPDAFVYVWSPIVQNQNLGDEVYDWEDAYEKAIEDEEDKTVDSKVVELPPGSIRIYSSSAEDLPIPAQEVIGEMLDPVQGVEIWQSRDDYPIIFAIRAGSTPRQ